MNQNFPVRHAGSPLRTNASLNRDVAKRCFAAGLTPAQIAAAWPEVFAVVEENGSGKLAQRYEYQLGDGSGRFETSRVITTRSADEVIAAHVEATTQHAVCLHCDRRISRLKAKKHGAWRTVDGKTRCDGRSGARWSRHQSY